MIKTLFVFIFLSIGKNIFAQQIAKVKDVQLIISTGTYLVCNGGLTFVGNSNLKNNNLSYIKFKSNNTINSNWIDSTSNGVIDPLSTGEVIVNTSSIANFYGKTNFYNLTIENDTTVNLNSNISVKNELSLNKGLVKTNIDTLKVLSFNSNAILSNSAFSKSWVNGFLSRNNNNSGINYLFPIGNDSFYAPIQINKANNNNATYTAKYFWSPPIDFNNFMNPPISRLSQLEYWTIESSNLSNALDDDAILSLSYRDKSVVSNSTAVRDSLLVAQYTPSPQWQPTGVNPANYQAIVTGNANFGFVQNTINVSFDATQHNFTLASRSMFNILPYQFLNWGVYKNNNTLQLFFAVENDFEIKNYIIEKSIDGVHFNPIATKNALQQNNSNYNEIDYTPSFGWNFYRIKIVHKNNAITYSVIKKIWFELNNQNVNISPNPAINFITVKMPIYNGTSKIVIVDAHGRRIYTTSLNANQIHLDVKSFPAGLYQINIVQGKKVLTSSFIKQ